ncbi:acyltransferase family protein [Serratia marcescens]|uniref:acyltransferase family protein n=1 Tax=Serratia marcescens TaxID=615 RepID=UPI0025AB2DE5|nr:acyltransferase [Serratia marcescens]MDN0030649.1 acyltransferase [Serratia marcescens]
MNRKLESLQALRGVAALLVLLFHYRFYLRGDDESGTTIWDALFGWGIIGVDIFFIISGFIMVYTTQHYMQGCSSAKRFLLNRAIRIIPLYYFGLLVAFLFGGAMSTFHYPEKVQNLLSALTFTVYKTSVTPHYIDDGGMYNIRWTLNYEIYFYLAFALCLMMKHRILALICWGGLMTCIIPALAGFQPTLSVQGYDFQTPTIAFITNPLLLEFLIGVFAGYIYLQLKRRVVSVKLPLISSVIAIGLLSYIVFGVYFGSIRALNLESTIVLGLLVLFLTLGEQVLQAYIPQVLKYVGNISFSLYLLHNPIGIAVMKQMGPVGQSAFKGIPTILLATLLSILVAHLTHKYIEVVLTRTLKNKFMPSKQSDQVTRADLAS